MAIILGRYSVVAVSTDGITYNSLGRVMSGGLNMGTDIADSTDNDSLGFKEGEYADSQADLDVTVHYDSANVGQAQVLAEVFTNKTKLYFRVRPKVAAGEKQWIFLATVDVSVDTETGGIEEANIKATSSGVVAMSAQ